MKITRNCTQYPRKPMNTNMISNWKENDMIKTYHAHLPPKNSEKQCTQNQLRENWEKKPLHGKFCKRKSDGDIYKYETLASLKSITLKVKTEGFILAAQDQNLKTKNC